MNGHPCDRLAGSPLVPIMVTRLNGTRGARVGKRATKDTGVPTLTSTGSEGCGIASTKGRLPGYFDDRQRNKPHFLSSGKESVNTAPLIAGIGVDAEGSVYGAVVRRQMLEKQVQIAS